MKIALVASIVKRPGVGEHQLKSVLLPGKTALLSFISNTPMTGMFLLALSLQFLFLFFCREETKHAENLLCIFRHQHFYHAGGLRFFMSFKEPYHASTLDPN